MQHEREAQRHALGAKMHRARLIQALGVATTADAIRIAVEAGLTASDRD